MKDAVRAILRGNLRRADDLAVSYIPPGIMETRTGSGLVVWRGPSNQRPLWSSGKPEGSEPPLGGDQPHNYSEPPC